MKYYSSLDINLMTATLDDSLGHKGNVVELWLDLMKRDKLDNIDYIYTCGPEKMILNVQKKAEDYGIKGECSLERRMGCGIGVCLSCVCNTKDGHQRTCKEGPVFSLDEVILDE